MWTNIKGHNGLVNFSFYNNFNYIHCFNFEAFINEYISCAADKFKEKRYCIILPI